MRAHAPGPDDMHLGNMRGSASRTLIAWRVAVPALPGFVLRDGSWRVLLWRGVAAW